MCTTEAALITSGVLKGTSDFLELQQAAASAEFRADMAQHEAIMLNIQASDVAEQGAAEASRLRQATSEAVASQIAQTAGAGIDVGGATARELFRSTEDIGLADVIQSQINTKKKIWSIRETGKIRKAEAKALRSSAKIARFVSPIALAGPILTARGQVGILQKKRDVAETTTKGKIL